MIDGSIVYSDTDLNDGPIAAVIANGTTKCCNLYEKSPSKHFEKTSAIWTVNSIRTLLRLYEEKLAMITTSKKKTKIWIAISDNLRDFDIEMSPDQVRWKINALTKVYKQCINTGQHNRFKYFAQLNNIYAQFNLSSYTKSKLVVKKANVQADQSCSDYEMQPENKIRIELRKNRLADKIESDRNQRKIQLEKQWLEYLTREEEESLLHDEICERKLQLRQEKIELRKRELQARESLELRKLQLYEIQHEEIFELEREKCEILNNIFS